MAKIVLGSAPKSFKHKVSFPMVGGGKGEITVEFRYRNRSQFAEFIAEIYPELKDGSATEAAEGVDVVGNSAKAVEREVHYILAAAQGWDLAEDFDAASIKQLVNEFPAAANAITTAYREAITEGKAKN